ncbi:hypothetical protein F4820DRAFT_411571 [Hypoxylon rubiginosum]|uniref:Uncharacterized protein n=1 Tax=Hypoxylon rubiginosum TaxID=110542 RepID=A0ACB9Z9B7_9PEZI|nr:hypothetical protein F4820DRAFT_411571 [Hypoxylon rubiginosum]
MTMAAAVQVMHSSASSTHQQAPHSTAPVLDFVCLFTRDLRRKQKRWQDGRLKYHTFNRRIMVHDDRGNFVGDAHWREDYDLEEGEELELERGGVMVQVAECTGSRDQDLSELVDKRAQEKAERQAAAMARRHPIHEPATPSAVAPHFQLRHKPLHNLIGTPTGHHGRALIPTESPYEERQKLAVLPQNESPRPAKRRKREISPPSKSGYARSLFGAALTLSGAPASTPPIRNRPPRSSPILIDDSQAPISPDTVPHDNNSDPAPELSHTVAADSLKERRTNAPKAQLLKSISRTHKSQRVVESESLSSPIGVDSAPSEYQNSVTNTKKPGLNRKGEANSRVRGGDLLQPISLNRSNPSKSRSRRDLFGDAHSLASPGGKEADTPIPTRGIEPLVQNQGRSAELGPKRTIESRSSDDGRQGVMLEQPTSEPRTELRIRPRKKRGLLISESLDVVNSAASRRAKRQVDRLSPSTSFKDTAMEDVGTALGKEKSTNVSIRESNTHRLKKGSAARAVENNGPKLSNTARFDPCDSWDAEDDDVPLTESRNNRSIETRKEQRGVPNAEDHEATPDTSSHLTQDDSSEEIVSNRKRSRAKDKRTRSLSPPHEDSVPARPSRRKQPSRKKKLTSATDGLDRRSEERGRNEEYTLSDEDELPLPGGAPPPRLAQLGRKSIRSKEVIGFMFDEDDLSSAPRHDESRGENNKQGLATAYLRRSQSIVQPATSAAKCMDPTTTNSDRVTTADQSPDHVPAKTARKAVDSITTESVKDRSTAASHVESIQHNQAQKQTGPVSVAVSSEPETSDRVPETTSGVQQLQTQPPARMVANPATRGKKAAKPSDAAGQIPQCPLPSEVAVGKPLEKGRLRPRPENRPQETVATPMPGFARANGGPWSREAHDLFEFTRPP